ncbi:flagellar brake protein [Fundidesulfovibrio terrae]|uniref:flagellar brake protein n=1 Tax=Fundidesulfovibrio terrae TaxID=2922866 RepID=UPI001FB03E26
MPTPPQHGQPESRRSPGFHLDVSLGQPCVLSFESDKERFRSSVIGLEPYQFLIIRLPGVPGIQQKLALGPGITLRLECEGTLWGFKSRVLKTVLSPAPMLVVAYPYSAERLQLRRHRRATCFLPARITNDFLDVDGLVTDISLGGCHIVLDGAVSEKVLNIMTGDPVVLTLNTEGDAPLRVDASVHRRKGGKVRQSLGLEFSSPAPDARERIARFVSRMEDAQNVLEQDSQP